MQMVEMPLVKQEASTQQSRSIVRHDDSISTKLNMQASINQTPTNLNAKYPHQLSSQYLQNSHMLLGQKSSAGGSNE